VCTLIESWSPDQIRSGDLPLYWYEYQPVFYTCHLLQDHTCSIPVGNCASKSAGQIRSGDHVCVCVCVCVCACVRVCVRLIHIYTSLYGHVCLCVTYIDIHI